MWIKLRTTFEHVFEIVRTLCFKGSSMWLSSRLGCGTSWHADDFCGCLWSKASAPASLAFGVGLLVKTGTIMLPCQIEDDHAILDSYGS